MAQQGFPSLPLLLTGQYPLLGAFDGGLGNSVAKTKWLVRTVTYRGLAKDFFETVGCRRSLELPGRRLIEDRWVSPIEHHQEINFECVRSAELPALRSTS